MATARLGRPADRQEWIIQELRQQIVDGQFLPGDRLPTREVLGQNFGASGMTIQRALDRLKSDGFVQSNGRNGTCVAAEPPHLTRFAVLFDDLPEQGAWSRFWTALSLEVQSLERSQNRRLPIYYYWETADETPISNYVHYDELRRDVEAHRVAGLIITSMPLMHGIDELLSRHPVPRVVITNVHAAGHDESPNLPFVALDRRSFWLKALDYLQAQGCRQPAFIVPYSLRSQQMEVEEWLAERGMRTRPYWWQSIHQKAPEAAHNCAHLLLHKNQGESPDALVIADDNLVEHATAGLLSAGRRVPGDLQVVAHCNFPHPTPAVVPVRRLGYNARQVLTACIASIDAQRRGEVIEPTIIPAVFEDEITTP